VKVQRMNEIEIQIETKRKQIKELQKENEALRWSTFKKVPE